MKSYLDNRSQTVSLGEKMSEQGILRCGVQQGSILDPLLSFIFMNDLPLFICEPVFPQIFMQMIRLFTTYRKTCPQ